MAKMQRRAVIAVTGVMVLLLWLSNLIRREHQVVFINLTPSMPEGVYYARRVGEWRKGMAVVFRLPAELDTFASQTTWLEAGGYLIKRVGALPGDQVCISRKEVLVNQQLVGKVAATDREGHTLPRLDGCLVVPPGYFLPLGEVCDQSFDGRYFGVVSQTEVRGEGVMIVDFGSLQQG